MVTNDGNDRNEESDEQEAKIAVFTTMATMWIDDDSFAFCGAKKTFTNPQ